MDGDDPMVDIAPRSDNDTPSYSGDQGHQEAMLREFHTKMAQDMAGIQTGLARLGQQIEAVPCQIAAEMTKSGASGEREWHSWVPVSFASSPASLNCSTCTDIPT
jgi:hypothetical protein